MIELFAIYKFCQLMGRTMRAKGYSPFGFQILLILAWILGEFVGGLIGMIFTESQGGTYLFALLGMAGGVGTIFTIAKLYPSKAPPPAADQHVAGAFPVEMSAAPNAGETNSVAPLR